MKLFNLLPTRQPRLTSKELGFFAGQLYFALEAGFSVSRGLSIIRARGRLARVLPEIERGIQGGEDLHVVFEKTGFPNFFTAMTKVGEESGRLDDIMRRLGDYYDKEAQLTGELKNAMIYPMIVCVLMVGVIAAALVIVIPGYANIFEANGVELP
ncbi:MAG: type II secretion system F family protein, partial [Defluviitaleaceae bacterium]|nr:type II secretion system F family protein [Defluviitaleaceae bacterium]